MASSSSKATGITAPSLEAFQPNLLEILGQKSLLQGDGIGSQFTRAMAPIKYGRDADAMRKAYVDSLGTANERALAAIQSQIMGDYATENMKQRGALLGVDPERLNANLGTINAEGFTRQGAPIDALARIFTQIAANKGQATAYKDYGAGADSLAQAGLVPQLPSFNTEMQDAGLPQSQTSVPTGVAAAGAGNPTKDVVTTTTKNGPNEVVTQSVRPPGTTQTQQQNIEGQVGAVQRATGQGQPLSTAETQFILRELKARVPNAKTINVDPSSYTTSQGKRVIRAMIDGKRVEIPVE